MTDTQQPLSGGFHHLALKVADFDATVKFYTEALGLVPTISWGEGDTRAIMLDAGQGNCLEIFAGGTPGAKPEGALLHFAFRAHDCAAALQRALDAGATLHMPPTELTIPSSPTPTPVRISFCIGLDGEIIEFFESAAG